MTKIYLNVPFSQKGEAKSYGALWDYDAKKWWIPDGIDTTYFQKWLPNKASKSVNDLSDEQKLVITTAKQGRNVLVDACIGSGKTTTIQTLCNEMSDKHILYLTYNTLLKEDAQATITSPNTYVTNYHGFACKVLGSRLHDYTTSVRQFAKEEPEIEHYDVLILDEYQDINEEIADMLKVIKKQLPDIQIIAVGDMEQKIYTNTIINAQNFIRHFLDDFEQLSFTKCFRLNEEHAAHLGSLWDKPIVGVNEQNEVLTLNIRDIPTYLNQFEPKDILCLGARDGEMIKTLNEIERLYPEKFNKNTVYASIRDEDRSQRVRENSAIFTTFDGAKGMERKVCVIFDYTEEYWDKRITKPDSEYTVLRNLFLVAMSRGKSQVVLTKGRDKHFLEDKTITTFVDHPYRHSKPFNVSDMFDFNYSEDIKRCVELIKIKPLEKQKKKVIDVSNYDGNIDISPCIGEYVEACFFDNYDIDRSVETAIDMNPDYHINQTGETLEEKILAITALQTKQSRYVKQVHPPFISDYHKRLIASRLSTIFNGDETVQQKRELIFESGRQQFKIMCMSDVIKDNTIFELKFTNEIKETYYLQCAMYICAFGFEKGYVWNIKTNEMYRITVPDRDKFLKAVVKSVTKHNITATKKIEIPTNILESGILHIKREPEIEYIPEPVEAIEEIELGE